MFGSGLYQYFLKILILSVPVFGLSYATPGPDNVKLDVICVGNVMDRVE